jgi:hypothetical protein
MPRPRRDVSSFDPGERVPLNFRVRQPLRRRIEQRADAAGRSMLSETEFMLERADAAEDQIGGLFDLAFGRVNSGIALLHGVILAESEGTTFEPRFDHPEGNATIAAALAWTISALTQTEITVARPEHISEPTWDMRLSMCLRPVARILDHLDGDPEAVPLRPLDEEIIKKLGPELCRRLHAKPFPVDPTRPIKPLVE